MLMRLASIINRVCTNEFPIHDTDLSSEYFFLMGGGGMGGMKH